MSASICQTGIRGGSAAAIARCVVLGHSQIDTCWHVLQTRSRHEKVVVDTLRGVGGEPFLPTVRRVMYYAHRKRIVESPLFAGYVFLWGSLEHAYAATASKKAVRIVPVADQATLAAELGNIRRAMESGVPLAAYDHLVKGRRVRVEAGPFQGIEGIVEEGCRNDRLILQVQAIGRALSLEIDASLLEPVDD